MTTPTPGGVNNLFREYLDSDTPPPVKPTDEPFTLTTWQLDFLAGAVVPAARQASKSVETLAPLVEWLISAGIITPPLPEEPRARALAAKQRQGKGPQPAASWRGRERATKFRSQS